jgi:hypothetical protein
MAIRLSLSANSLSRSNTNAHHWGLDHSLSFVGVVIVLEVIPDPERTFIVWTKIVTNHNLLSMLIVSFDSVLVGVGQGPVESFLVDFTASISNLVILVEV